MKIMIGPTDICGIGKILKREWERRGIEVTIELPTTTQDRIINFIKNLNADIWIYNYGEPWLPWFEDLRILAALRKKIIVIFHGCDIRKPDHVSNPFCQDCHICEKIVQYHMHDVTIAEYNRIMIGKFERYANKILARKEYAEQLHRKYEPFTLPIDLGEIQNVKTKHPLTVTHITSNPYINGSSYIIDTVKQLKKEGFRFRFIYRCKIPHDDVLKIIRSSDIVIDRVNSQQIGMLGLEVLAHGKCLVSSIPEYIPGYPATSSTIYEVLRYLLSKPGLIRADEARRRAYVAEHHDSRKVADEMLHDIIIPSVLKDWYRIHELLGVDNMP